MSHQFTLFGFQKPRKKVPISEDRIKEVQALMANGDKDAVVKLREIRYGLENYLKRIH